MTVQNPVSEKAISVTELNATIAACMDAPVFKGLEVYGEVSGGRVSGGHFYFTLKDKNSEMPCVKFRAAGTYSALRAPTSPRTGRAWCCAAA